MEKIETGIKDLYIIKPNVFYDDRGYFYESYNYNSFKKLDLDVVFKQDNQSLSQKGTIRALHFQEPPHAQLKLVRVVNGAVFDVAVDLRKNSPTYGEWFGTVLSAENKMMLWIPEGFAHGFQALENNTIFHYKCSDFYHPECENSIIWNDVTLNINWFDIKPIISKKDKMSKTFLDFESKL
ncbi:MAG: dTDP-4-dehydrorhamnose 3,5-epimerase [Bacteroidales bacterium]|jgi:dTDP-4-dehydrorhamnose 3,5-epimerase